MRVVILFSLATLFACGQQPASDYELASLGKVPYPQAPDEEMTPGTLCDSPDYYRYKEKIGYCKRNVHTSTKREVIAEYDRELGYRVGSMPRGQFKVDHYIPLCAGGSNQKANLWPQHKTVYQHTDPIEQKVCILMSDSKMLQQEAVSIIRHVKFNLNEARKIDRDLQNRIDGW